MPVDTLHLDLAAALDPVVFARQQLDFQPNPWQATVLRSPSKRLLLNASRQSGKSSVTALLAPHQVLYFLKSLILLLSPSLRQSQELYRKVRQAYGQVDSDVLKPAEESALRLELSNGSRIVSLPGKEATIRGFSGVSLLIVDEAARVLDELYFAVRPMLAVSSGRLIALSTPFGKRGWWYEEWQNGEGWQRVRIPATDCPRISAAFLEEERRTLGDWWFNQEYMCIFGETVDTVFRYDDVAAAFDETVTPLFGGDDAG